jgi:hypothetical protein
MGAIGHSFDASEMKIYKKVNELFELSAFNTSNNIRQVRIKLMIVFYF